jgi:hypothetical protein
MIYQSADNALNPRQTVMDIAVMGAPDHCCPPSHRWIHAGWMTSWPLIAVVEPGTASLTDFDAVL